MIGRNHPVREAFSGCSTGNDEGRYYGSKNAAFSVFNAVLMDYDHYLESEEWPGDYGSRLLTIWRCNGNEEPAGYAYFTWHRMESGNWEVIGYIT